ARRSAVGRPGPRAGDRAGSRYRQDPDGRLDEPRSAGRDGGQPARRLLVSLARAALAQGRGVRTRATASRAAARLRRRRHRPGRRAAGWNRLSHESAFLLLPALLTWRLEDRRAGAEGSRGYLPMSADDDAR